MKTDIKDKNKNNKETHPHSRMQETELIVKLANCTFGFVYGS